MKIIYLILLSSFLVSCNASYHKDKNNFIYEVIVGDHVYRCKFKEFHTYGIQLRICKRNDGTEIIKEIDGAVNVIEVVE